MEETPVAARQFIAIEYPGNVVNVDKMFETLGGIQNISNVFNGEQKSLELHYHAKNACNKPATATLNENKTGLLLSVKIRRSKKDAKRIIKQELSILGHCYKAYSFENLCDFQYLPLLRTNGNFVNVLEQIEPKSVTDIDYFSRENAPLLSVPIHFARSDLVPASIFRSDKNEDGQQDTLGEAQRTATDPRDVVKFSLDEALPHEADPAMAKRMRVKYITDEQYDKVRALFVKCPIWSRVAILYETGISPDKLKYISPCFAFYYSNGPWRSMFVRYGYDPRKDAQSRFYQTFDFRLRYRSAILNWLACRRDLLAKKEEDAPDIFQTSKYPYIDEHKLPYTRQCLVRYCDVHIPIVQEMLEKTHEVTHAGICDARFGFLPNGFDAKVRTIVLDCIKTVLGNYFRQQKDTPAFDADNVEQEVMEDMDMSAEQSEASNDSESELPEEYKDILETAEQTDE